MTSIEPIYSGVVKEYSDKMGYGFVEADPDQGIAGLLLVHRNSLRRRDLELQAGDRVAFSTQSVPTGLLAADVRPLVFLSPDSADSDRVFGVVARWFPERGFGFIQLQSGETAFFHISGLVDPSSIVVVGARVSFRIQQMTRGPLASDIRIEPSRVVAPQQDYLALAIIARDDRRYDDAAALYEKGLHQEPSVQLVLSYAAMEKNRNRPTAAMRVYQVGIARFPTNAKLREDAGTLAASLDDFERALTFLDEARRLCDNYNQRGKKGVLLALARVHFKIATHSSLQRSIEYYESARNLFSGGHTRLPDRDLLALHIARIRTQHHRGNLACVFFERAEFKIVRARLLDQSTEGAELIVEVDATELSESYGLSRFLVVRCMFKSDVTAADLDDFDQSVQQWSSSGLGDEQVALIVVGSLPPELQRQLSKRIENKSKSLPALVPIQQRDVEGEEDPIAILRAVLDRWLYRRDLFAGRGPVVGRRFFGRDKPLVELREAIATATPVGVFGLRKVGKTSLLKEMRRRASEWGDVVVYVDLLSVPSDVTDCRWLYWRLATDLCRESSRLPLKHMQWRLGGCFEDFLAVPAEFPVATAFDSDLTRLMANLRNLSPNSRPKVVVLLDEIERILPTRIGRHGLAGFFDFFGYLRGVSQECEDFLLVVTGANTLVTEAAQFDGRDNPVFNYFTEIHLQLLERSECALMLRELGRGMGITFTADAQAEVYSLTGGHPFFARQLCSFVARQYAERPMLVDRDRVVSVIDQYIDVRSSDFQEIMDRLRRDFPEEFEICVKLAHHGGRLPAKDIRRLATDARGSAIRHLLGYQIVSVVESDAVLTVDLLRRWLVERYPSNAKPE